MRRVRVLVAVLTMMGMLASAIPAGADSHQTCGAFFARATLDVYGGQDSTTGLFADGTANVLFDGSHYRATIAETDAGGFGAPGDPTGFTVQEWTFGGMEVTFYETAYSAPLFGPMWSVDSEVEVIAGGSGDLRYDGLYHSTNMVARYFVTGDICIDS